MQPEQPGGEPVLGLHAESQALGKTGEALFTSSGQPSIWVNQVRARLMEDARNTVHSFGFLEALSNLKLIRAIDLVLSYQDEETDRITGLHVINEDALQSLSAAQLISLRDKGYLAPIYAMLTSVFQVNTLIRLHNSVYPNRKIARVSLEVSKI